MGEEKGTMSSLPTTVDESRVAPPGVIVGDDAEDERLLKEADKEATSYLDGFDWCDGVLETRLGLGIGGIFAVFLCHIAPAAPEVDEWLWVVVGDLPPLYMPTDDCPNPAAALDAYIGAMSEWVSAVREGRPLDDVPPVAAAPTMEHAAMLESRLNYLDEEILQEHQADLAE